MHRITLVFEDGRSVAIEARPDETAHAAALRQKVRLETDCLEGACATCRCLCTGGEFEMRDYSDEALPAGEAAQGHVLACRLQARSDCVLEFPYPSATALARRPAGEWRARVALVERVSATVVRLDLETPAPVAFLPGQYAHLAVPGSGAQRSYSFANPPAEATRHRFYVKLIEGGAMSGWVSEVARPGDEIAMRGPFGHFYLRPPRGPLLMVAGGTGLAPMLSMLEHLAGTGGCEPPIRLLYGANGRAEFFALDQLERLRAAGLPLTVECVPLAGDAQWHGPTGHVTALLRPEHAAGEAYLCGPPPMIDAARASLKDAGMAEAAIHAERFVAS